MRNAMRATSNWTQRFPRTTQEAFGVYNPWRSPYRRAAERRRLVGTIICATFSVALVCGLTTFAFIVATN